MEASANMPSLPITIELSLHSTDYIVNLSSPQDDTLRIAAEEKLTGNIWKNEFTSKYIEEITQKTGSPKKYPIFLKMLVSALKQDNDSVYMDILTYQDLELLKSRKASNTSGATPTSNTSITKPGKTPSNNKRYIILTYSGEFERVHYPLPLSFVDNPDPDSMKTTISRLARELEQYKGRTGSMEMAAAASLPVNLLGGSDANSVSTPNSTVYATSNPNLKELQEETERLRRKVALMEKERVGGAVEMDLLSKDSFSKAQDFETSLREADHEIQQLRSQLSQTQTELSGTKEELFKTRSEMGHYDQVQTMPDIETLRKQIGELSCTLEDERRDSKVMLEDQRKELNMSLQELDQYRENEKKMKVRVKQLENELEQAMKKLNYSMYGKSRPNSTTSQKSNASSASSKYSNSSSKRSSSVPNNQKAGARRTTPVRGNNYGGYNRQTPPTKPTPFRPHYSPASSSNRSNSGSRGRAPNPTGAYNGGVKKAYSPTTNRLYSPSGMPRNNRPGGRAMGAVDRVSPLRAANNQRPKVPSAVKKPSPAPNRPSPGGNRQSPAGNRQSPGARRPPPPNSSKGTESKGNVFSRLYAAPPPVSRPIREEAKRPPPKAGNNSSGRGGAVKKPAMKVNLIIKLLIKIIGGSSD